MISIWNEVQDLEFSQKFYDVNGVRTRAIECGSGPALILIHGTGGHAEAYMRNLKAHADHFSVYAIDMIGHGYTDHPLDHDYEMQGYVDHLLGFMDAAGIEKAHLSGESLGGSVCLWFALAHPDRVGKICLNTGMPIAPTTEAGVKQMEALLERSRAASGAPSREAVQARLAWLMADPEASISDELIEARYRIYTQDNRPEIMKRITERAILGLLDPATQETWNNPQNLANAPCPVLVLWTHHNPGQPLEMAQELSKLIPDHEMVVLENSAHWPQWEEPEKFNDAHIKFFLS